MDSFRTLRVDGEHVPVTVHAAADDGVVIRVGTEPDGVTLVGSRYDVHRVVLELDRQLGRLGSRFRAC